jgi:hypothetical protein
VLQYVRGIDVLLPHLYRLINLRTFHIHFNRHGVITMGQFSFTIPSATLLINLLSQLPAVFITLHCEGDGNVYNETDLKLLKSHHRIHIE